MKRAAVLGAAAWTAPAIVGSVASPAGALTTTGCYRAQFNRTGTTLGGCATLTQVVPDNGAGCLDPNLWNNLLPYPFTVTIQVTGTFPSCVYTITLAPGSTCVLDLRTVARKDNASTGPQANACQTGAFVGTGCQSIEIMPPFVPDRFKILISCGGVICPGGTACPTAQSAARRARTSMS
jgi:hypothetical protein